MKNKILIIDDQDIIRELVKEMLEVFDVETYEAESMAEAIKIFKEKHNEIFLIFFDLHLDGATGVEVYEELKKISTDFVPVLATGEHIDSTNTKYHDIGFKEIVIKPYKLASLQELIKKYS